MVNDFRIDAPAALRFNKKNRKKTMGTEKTNNKSAKNVEEKVVDASVEHIKELEEELLKSRIGTLSLYCTDSSIQVSLLFVAPCNILCIFNSSL